MNARCPSDLALEGYLLERDTSNVAPHVGSCERCKARIAQMEREGQEFLRYVYPATVARVEEAAAGRRSPWRRWALLLPIPAAAAIAAVLLVALPGTRGPAGPPEGYVGLKGGGGSLGLTVFLGAAEGARPLADGEAVPAASALRFKVQPTRACRLWVVSIDASGQVSRLYPVDGDGGAKIAHGGPLPGGAVLDGRAGPERIFALCTPSPVSYSAIERTLRKAVGEGDAAVQRQTDIPGFPDGTIQTSVLIHKRP
jgi:hypothetical protein